MNPAPPVTRMLDMSLPRPPSGPVSRIRRGGGLLLARAAFLARLGAFLAVVMQDTLADLALVHARHDVPQPLIDVRVVDQAADGPVALVDLRQDRVDVS